MARVANEIASEQKALGWFIGGTFHLGVFRIVFRGDVLHMVHFAPQSECVQVFSLSGSRA
jgi:hypothetical protein